MVFKNSLDGKILHIKIVKNEKIRDSVRGVGFIKVKDISVQAIVADERRGIFSAFGDVPMQLCQPHQVKTVTKYLTKQPKLETSKELRQISLWL